MDWARKDGAAEWAVDVGAAAIFAAAAGFAAWAVAAAGPASVAAMAALAFLLVCAALRRVPAEEPSYALPHFQLAPIEPAGRQPEIADELLLDDRLTAVEPDARVVQLFDPSRTPSVDGSRSAAPDASQALSDALAQLRRSLH